MGRVPLEILGQDEVTGLKIRNIKTNEERELTADGVSLLWGSFLIRHL